MGVQLIELLGPSGVGKSTILRVLQGEPCAMEWKFPTSAVTSSPESKVDRTRIMRAFDAIETRPFIDWAVACISRTDMPPSRRLNATSFLARSCHDRAACSMEHGVIVHDELLLHRAFSFMHHSTNLAQDARRYFQLAPAPAAAIVFTAAGEAIADRVLQRPKIPNCYADLTRPRLLQAIERAIMVADIALEVLSERGIPVSLIDASHEVPENARRLSTFVSEVISGARHA